MIDLRLDPDPAAMFVDDALDRGEAEPGSRELILRMEALEGFEQVLGLGRVEAGAVVV